MLMTIAIPSLMKVIQAQNQVKAQNTNQVPAVPVPALAVPVPAVQVVPVPAHLIQDLVPHLVEVLHLVVLLQVDLVEVLHLVAVHLAVPVILQAIY